MQIQSFCPNLRLVWGGEHHEGHSIETTPLVGASASASGQYVGQIQTLQAALIVQFVYYIIWAMRQPAHGAGTALTAGARWSQPQTSDIHNRRRLDSRRDGR